LPTFFPGDVFLTPVYALQPVAVLKDVLGGFKTDMMQLFV
jgi:hypothetical protein